MIWVLLVSALAVVLFGFTIRPIGGISKIYDTPSWVCISLAISLVVYAIILYLVDIKNRKDWFRIILPAGTSTLTCYLMPYLYYGFYSLALANPWKIPIRLPLILRTGIPGLIKSMVFSLFIITLVGILEKRKLRLKL
jgi:predicted acyltransferase